MPEQILPATPAKESPKHVLWAFREIKGSKDDLMAAIAASSAEDCDKAWLVARIQKLEGKAFRIDSQGMSEHAGELAVHVHISKIF